jgi:hypothetical protein
MSREAAFDVLSPAALARPCASQGPRVRGCDRRELPPATDAVELMLATHLRRWRHA